MLKRYGLCAAAVCLACAGAAWAGDAAVGGAAMTHRMMLLVIQLGVILFAARLGSRLLERMRLPGVLGELAAGMLIGPYLLGALGLPGFPDGLFPAQGTFPVSPELYGICSVAAVLLLFMVGLETDIRLFMRYSLAGTLVGIGGVVVSFVVGDVLAMAFARALFGEAKDFFAAPCLFMGIVATATSVGITARILAEQRKLDSPEGVTILAGAVVDDVLGIVLLAIGLGVISASRETGAIDWGHIGIIALKAVGVWLAATVVGLTASRRIGLLLKSFRDRSAIAIMALGLALIMAGLFEQAGLAMIVGAYVMGLSLSRTDIAHVIRERLAPIHAFLIPVFFTVMGMAVDLRLLASGRVLIFGVLYTLGVIIAKMAGCGVPVLFCGFNRIGALRVGCGMLPRGEVTLIIAGIGLAAGVLNSQVFGVVVMMIVVTALLAPPALVALFRRPGSGLRRPPPGGDTESLRFEFPSGEAAEMLVGKLLAVFESEGYYVHALGRGGRLYQIRKDRVVIAFRHEGPQIVFACRREDVPLVNAAMLEVVADMERTVRELTRPLDTAAIGRRLQDEAGATSGRSAMARYLTRATLQPRLRGTTKQDAIEELLDLLDRAGLLRDRAAAAAAVWERENSMSTGMQHGIAIPHGRTDAVDRLVCAVGLCPAGIDFESIDGAPARMIVLTLSPRRAATPHVQFMSTISQILDEAGRKALLACETPAAMAAVLGGRG
jgi:Kef-type K+ transport system membrane component KefB/mannitol/fructose-specific phosphotransferase system IIA component (Ntr-type)